MMNTRWARDALAGLRAARSVLCTPAAMAAGMCGSDFPVGAIAMQSTPVSSVVSPSLCNLTWAIQYAATTFGNASGAAYITNALICSSNNCNSFATIAAAGYGSNVMSSIPAMTSAGNRPAAAAVAGAIVALLLALLI